MSRAYPRTVTDRQNRPMQTINGNEDFRRESGRGTIIDVSCRRREIFAFDGVGRHLAFSMHLDRVLPQPTLTANDKVVTVNIASNSKARNLLKFVDVIN